MAEIADAADAQRTGDKVRIARTRTLLTGLAVVTLATSCGAQQPADPPATLATAQSSQPAAAPAIAAPSTSAVNVGACVLSPSELQQLLGEWLGPGEVTINKAYTEGNRCTYNLPKGSLPLDGHGGEAFTGTPTKSFVIDQYEYANPTDHEIGVRDTQRKYGGTTPKEVFDSVAIAIADTHAAAGFTAKMEKFPEIGGGAVSDGGSGFTLATTGAYWYQAGVSGAKNDPRYVPALLEVAKAVNGKG